MVLSIIWDIPESERNKNKKQRTAIGALGGSSESSVLGARRLDSHENRS